jgi:small conductance mechanosensitive channel
MNQLSREVLQRLRETFSGEALGTLLAHVAVQVLVGIIVFAVFYGIWRLVRLALTPMLRRGKLDRTARSFIQTLAKYTILVIGVLVALDAARVRMPAVLASVGIVGLTVGFAARDSLSNLISGVLIYLDRPFVLGDLVEIEKWYGRVERITLRSTRIVTPDGRMLAVPNSEMINKTVVSYTNFPHLRLDIPITIAVTEDLGRAREALLELVRGHDAFRDEPAPRVVVTRLNDYNVVLELQAWLDDERRHIAERYALRESMFEVLRRAGIEMPYETVRVLSTAAPSDVPAGSGGTASSLDK